MDRVIADMRRPPLMNPGVGQGVGAQFLLSVSAELMKGFIPGVSRARTSKFRWLRRLCIGVQSLISEPRLHEVRS
jgi:hypothetical protein